MYVMIMIKGWLHMLGRMRVQRRRAALPPTVCPEPAGGGRRVHTCAQAPHSAVNISHVIAVVF